MSVQMSTYYRLHCSVRLGFLLIILFLFAYTLKWSVCMILAIVWMSSPRHYLIFIYNISYSYFSGTSLLSSSFPGRPRIYFFIASIHCLFERPLLVTNMLQLTSSVYETKSSWWMLHWFFCSWKILSLGRISLRFWTIFYDWSEDCLDI